MEKKTVTVILSNDCNEIEWSNILGEKYRDWFVNVELISTNSKTVIIMSDSKTDSLVWGIVKASPDDYSFQRPMLLKTLIGFTQYYPQTYDDFNDNFVRGNLYIKKSWSCNIISMGERVIEDDVFYRTTSISLQCPESEFEMLIRFNCILNG